MSDSPHLATVGTLEPGKEFPLVRFFVLVSAFVLGVATFASTIWTVRHERQELISSSAAYATEIVANVFHQVEEEFLQPLLERAETFDSTDSEHTEALGQVVERAIFKHRVRKLYFFDPSGLIVFSTQREHIGQQLPENNQHFLEAARGGVSWVLKKRNDPLDLTGNPTSEELLETYVPVYSRLAPDPTAVIGVIEIYQDVKELRTKLATFQRDLVVRAVVQLGALYLVFLYFVLRAARVIRQRREQLVTSNQALQDLSRDLESLVEQRTQQLIEKEKLASLGGLAAGVAHEINTPLGTIAVASEGSLRRLAELADVDEPPLCEVRDYLELIHSETFHCEQITRSLLDYSRQAPLTASSEVDLNALVEQAVILLRLNHDSRGVTFDVDLQGPTTGCFGDPTQLRQVLHNLIENALHAVVQVERPRVVLRTREEGHRIVFECEDNGVGVDPQVREKIFEPFFTTKYAGDGVGLGLALSFSIVQRHGGALELVQRPSADGASGGSTLFRVTLPLGPPETLGEP